MKPLVLTISCARDRERHRAIQHTWLGRWGEFIDHRFVVSDDGVKGDLEVDAPDDYSGVPIKHQQAISWAADYGYENIFMSDIDTYIAVHRLLCSGYEKYDFIGARCAGENHQSGGAGYWLSRKTFEPLIAAQTKGHSWSDMWTWHTLEKAGIHLHDDQRYASSSTVIPTKEEWDTGIISVHLGRAGGFDVSTMYRCHESFLRGVSCDQ